MTRFFAATTMSNHEVRVGNAQVDGIDVLPANNTLCGAVAAPAATAAFTITCSSPLVGRFVTVQRTVNTSTSMFLCEVQVFAQPSLLPAPPLPSNMTNLALRKPAFTSGATAPFLAALAVDGNPDTVWGSVAPTCFQSSQVADPWWYVDLGYEQSVYALRITPRDDSNSGRCDHTHVLLPLISLLCTEICAFNYACIQLQSTCLTECMLGMLERHVQRIPAQCIEYTQEDFFSSEGPVVAVLLCS